MKFFLDTADVAVARTYADLGWIDGITTNPSLIASSGNKHEDVIAAMCSLTEGSVSAEVVATEVDGMVREGLALRTIAPNVTIKVPLTKDGLQACRQLVGEGIQVNVTLCFSAVQALMAARAGATYISPFIGRIDDMSIDGMELIEEIRIIYDNYGFETQILAASVRSVTHVRDAALAGADVATVPPKVLEALISHPLTDAGLEKFMADWRASQS